MTVAVPHAVPQRLIQSGVSNASLALKRFAGKIDVHMNKPVSMARNHLIGQIFQILRSCARAGWDGSNAAPVSVDSARAAVELIWGLPPGAAAPDISPESSGTIAFEWRRDEDKIFAVTVTGKRTLVYAGVLGSGEVIHGTKPFMGSIPVDLQEIVLDYFS